MTFNPFLSILKSVLLFITLRITKNREYDGLKIKIDDNEYSIFRHIAIKSPEATESPVVLVLRFRFDHSSLEKDRFESFFQIPVFIGLPGFQEKVWTFDGNNGVFQGVYQWKNKSFAEGYLNSFAVKYVRKKAQKDSVFHQIIPKTTLSQYINVTGALNK